MAVASGAKPEWRKLVLALGTPERANRGETFGTRERRPPET